MATLFVKEFTNQGLTVTNVPVPVPAEPSIAEQTVAISAGSTQSAAFQATTQLVGVTCDAICSIKVGTNPTATAVMQRLPAGATYYFTVPPGLAYKIACIVNT